MPSGGRRSTSWTKTSKRPKGGRPLGAKDKIPRSLKGSVKAICQEVAENEPDLIRQTIIRGLRSRAPRSFLYLQLVAAYVDGKPTEHMTLEGGVNVNVTVTARQQLAERLARLAERRGAITVHQLPERGTGGSAPV